MDTSSSIPILKSIIPKVPLIGRTVLYHTLGLSDTGKQWDLRTELTVKVLRSFILGSPPTISKLQRSSLKDPGIKGRIWISKVIMKEPQEDDVCQVLFKVIEAMKGSQSPGGYSEPELVPVEAEWTGYRAGATKRSPELRISEAQKYSELMREATSPITILYMHGGAYYLMDPASHRPTTSKLAKFTNGRCLSIRYRLAPQHPFPAALLDALVCYLNLLYPLEDSYHAPVEPNHIVFSGDSAGGNLALALLQTILEINRQGLQITWNGKTRNVPIPSGVALCSGWFDITLSSPSCETNGKWDYLPPRGIAQAGFPKCPIWPATPPRKNMYAEDNMLCHPLVSPMAAKSWKGSCPLWIITGQELLTDEDKWVAQTAARQGIRVVFEEYEAMPHCFGMVLEGLECSRRCFTGWSSFIKAAVEHPEKIVTIGTKFQAQSLKEIELDVKKLTSFTEEEVMTRMQESAAHLNGEYPDPLSKL